MHTVLLADGDARFLEELGRLPVWEAEGFRLVGAASEEQAALSLMEETAPDVVFAGLRLSGLDGLLLARRAAERFPETRFVFVADTSEYALVRASAHFFSAQYIIKAPLNEEEIRKALQGCEAPVRGAPAPAEPSPRNRALEDSLCRFLDSTEEAFAEDAPPALWDGYILAEIRFLYPFILDGSDAWEAAFQRLREITKELAREVFSAYTLLEAPDGAGITLLVWGGEPGECEARLRGFQKRLILASCQERGAQPCLLVTETGWSREDMEARREQLGTLRRYFYLSGAGFLRYGAIEAPQLAAMRPAGGSVRQLQSEIIRRSHAGCCRLFEQLERSVATPHEKEEAQVLLGALFAVARKTLLSRKIAPEGILAHPSACQALPLLATKAQSMDFFEALRDSVLSTVRPSETQKATLTEQVKRYMASHLGQRNLPEHLARHINIAPMHLATMFQEQCGVSLTEFIQTTRVEKACKLMAAEHSAVDIVPLLGFEDSGSFARIFKHYKGQTPDEYYDALRAAQESPLQ